MKTHSDRDHDNEYDVQPAEKAKEACDESPAQYTIFTGREKTVIVILIATAGFFSPFTAFIYFPALQSIASDLHVTIELLNITVTVYLLVQALVPAILGDLSENIGRRPVYLLIFIIYSAASIGLAVQRNYAALLVLRMLQSAGSSGTIALAYGVIGDIAAPHERGTFVGVSHIGFNSAPALGPVIGGLIADKSGWLWIFVFLAAFSGLLLLLLAFFLAETARSIVGNGSIPTNRLNTSFSQLMRRGRLPDENHRVRLHVPNIVPCLKLIFHKNTAPVLLANAIFYMMYSCLQASLAPLLQERYGLSPFQGGLCYISFGVGAGAASYIVGRITDRDYRITALKHKLSIDPIRGDNLLHFPIEEARLRSAWTYIPLCSTAVLGYGWTITAHVHLSAPLILLFIVGMTVTGIFNVCNTLIVDVNEEKPATASASVSITRCLMAAGGMSIIEVVLNRIGPGWTFTIIGGMCWATIPVLMVVKTRGWDWGKAKAERTISIIRE